MFQDPNAALNPRMTILDSVIGSQSRFMQGRHATNPGGAQERVSQWLARRAAAASLRAAIRTSFPAGQKHCVNIARVPMLRPKVIVCDEVVAALDVSIRGDILNLFADLQREFNLTYVFITHDISVVSHISDRIAVTYLGRLMELGAAEDVIEQPLHPYTQALLSAEPVPLPSTLRANRRIVLEGEIPSPVTPPSGCRFRTRCPAVQARCAEEVPVWRELKPGHWVACHFSTVEGHTSSRDANRQETTAFGRTAMTDGISDSIGRLSRRDVFILAGGVALAGTTGLPALAQEAAKKGGILKVAALANPSSLDPATGGSGFDHNMLWTMYDTLVEWDYGTLKPKPGLAKWSYPDPKTMVLDIGKGVKFHDGTDLDAEAVKFNIERNPPRCALQRQGGSHQRRVGGRHRAAAGDATAEESGQGAAPRSGSDRAGV